MLTQEQRATTSAKWLAHWQGCRVAGIAMAEYARREGIDADAAYRWQRILRRTGLWTAGATTATATSRKRSASVRFARVAVSDAPPPASMLLRLVLKNGRRADLEIGAIANLSEVLGILEQGA